VYNILKSDDITNRKHCLKNKLKYQSIWFYSAPGRNCFKKYIVYCKSTFLICLQIFRNQKSFLKKFCKYKNKKSVTSCHGSLGSAPSQISGKSLYYSQTKKTVNTENISGMFIVLILCWPITCETLQPQKTNGFLSRRIKLVLNLFQKTSRFNLHLILQELKVLFLSIWEPCALRKQK